MYLMDHVITCEVSERIEIFPFYDVHIGKYNCAEDALRKQIDEILRREKLPGRIVRVIFGGDQLNAINTADAKRFDFGELADWFVEGDALEIKERLGNMVDQEISRAVEIFKPIAHLTIGALTGNHEKAMKTRQNLNVHAALCDRLGITNLTDEAIIRLKIKALPTRQSSTVRLYLRHGYGAGRTPGAEPNKLARMVDEWEGIDVCLSGHSHSFFKIPPKPVPYIPSSGALPKRLRYHYRFGANPGCWLLSHKEGPGSYESMACYPARPMTTLKIVIWPFWRYRVDGFRHTQPKIELRDYPIL